MKLLKQVNKNRTNNPEKVFQTQMSHETDREILIDCKKSNNIETIFSPTAGKIFTLNQVNDEVFKKGMMGQGVAIFPKISDIYSPVNGRVKFIPTTKHAMAIESDKGVEILIHIGLDTVNLKGEHFEVFVKNGDKVTIGDHLLNFDLQAIQMLGYDMITPIVVINSSNYSRIVPIDENEVSVSDPLIYIS